MHPENEAGKVYIYTWGQSILKMEQHRYTFAHRGTDLLRTPESYHSTVTIKLQEGFIQYSVGQLLTFQSLVSCSSISLLSEPMPERV